MVPRLSPPPRSLQFYFTYFVNFGFFFFLSMSIILFSCHLVAGFPLDFSFFLLVGVDSHERTYSLFFLSLFFLGSSLSLPSILRTLCVYELLAGRRSTK